MTESPHDPCQNIALPHAHSLSLSRLYDAPPETVFRAWAEPELLRQWFVPKPWRISHVDQQLLPGGRALVVMQDPDGKEYPNDGVFLEVVPNRKIVSTNIFTSGWQPADPQPVRLVAVITFEAEGQNQTRYTASALHWTAADRNTHEKMGFHEGWGICADQLGELLARL